MYIKPPERDRLREVQRKPPRRWRDRPLVAASVLLHVALLLALWLVRVPKPEPEPPPSSEVAVVFDNPAGPSPASTASPDATPDPKVATGNPDAPPAPPTQDTTPPAASAAPPSPDTPEPAPSVFASIEPTPQPPAPAQAPPVRLPAQAPPPSLSFSPDELPFQMPPLTVPETPAPPTPRPPPHVAARPPARSGSPLANPQDWSLNSNARPAVPGHASKGLDFGVSPESGSSEADMAYVAGARPSGDWQSAIRRWAQARIYYPQQAVANGEEGTASVTIEIERSGRVLSVKLLRSARSPFLDGAWIDIWRNAHVPPFTPDMTEPTTTIVFNLRYHLIRR